MRDLTRTRLCDPLGHNAWQQRTGELVKGRESEQAWWFAHRAAITVCGSEGNADVSA
jgi:hypothetical protein